MYDGPFCQDLAQQNTQRKVIVGDSGYANTVFLAVFVLLQHVVALVRLHSNQVLYAAPPAYCGHWRPRKHGALQGVQAWLGGRSSVYH